MANLSAFAQEMFLDSLSGVALPSRKLFTFSTEYKFKLHSGDPGESCTLNDVTNTLIGDDFSSVISDCFDYGTLTLTLDNEHRMFTGSAIEFSNAIADGSASWLSMWTTDPSSEIGVQPLWKIPYSITVNNGDPISIAAGDLFISLRGGTGHLLRSSLLEWISNDSLGGSVASTSYFLAFFNGGLTGANDTGNEVTSIIRPSGRFEIPISDFGNLVSGTPSQKSNTSAYDLGTVDADQLVDAWALCSQALGSMVPLQFGYLSPARNFIAGDPVTFPVGRIQLRMD